MSRWDPAPSEAFATVDIRALQKMSHQVHVACFHTQLKNTEVRGPEKISYCTWKTLYKSCRLGLMRPRTVVELVGAALTGRRKSRLLALLAIPPALEIFQEIQKEKVDAVHLFWGHYPALVGKYCPQMPRILVSAYPM